MRRLVFHIGMPKCGTSTIQRFAATHADLLKNKNCYYPLLSKYDESSPKPKSVSTGNANSLVNAISSESDIIEKHENSALNHLLLNLVDDFLQINSDVTLLSHEGFINLSPKTMSFVIKVFRENNFNVEAVLYMRHQSEWLASDYQQHIKQLRSSDDIYTHVGKRLTACEYIKHCNRWASLVGKNNLTVRLLSKQTIEHNLIYDFFKTINVNTDGFEDIAFKNVNESLGRYATQSLQLINGFDISQAAYKELCVAVNKFDLKNGMSKYSLPSDLDKLVREYFKKHNLEFAHKYLNESDSKFFIENGMPD